MVILFSFFRMTFIEKFCYFLKLKGSDQVKVAREISIKALKNNFNETDLNLFVDAGEVMAVVVIFGLMSHIGEV